jgi:hypothetical protein
MNQRHLKAHIKRLERAVAAAEADLDPAKRFIIDPALARALRDDYELIYELSYQLDCTTLYRDIDRDETQKEICRLRASITERARAIVCPASYGLEEQIIDCHLLKRVEGLRRPWGSTSMTAAEDAEEAQARARNLAFQETWQRDRLRREELETKDLTGGRTAAEQEELDDLRRRYPPPPPVPEDAIKQDPTYAAILVVEREVAKAKERDKEYERQWNADRAKRKDEDGG